MVSVCLILGSLTGAGLAKKYSGVKIIVGAMTGPYVSGPVKTHRGEWQEKTGGKVELVEIPYGSLYEKFMTPFLTGTHAYDIIIMPPTWDADIMGGGYVLPLDKYIDKDSYWYEDIVPVFREDVVGWSGKTYAVLLDGARHMCYYRRDIIENPKNKVNFRAEYGYDLGPPKTWEEYQDIAEFFNGWDWDGDGEMEYGAVESMVRNAQMVWTFFSRCSAYCCVPGDKGSLFFNPRTMEPLINDPGHVKGLEKFVAIKKFGPPGVVGYDVGDVRRGYAIGDAALAIDWEDIGQICADPEKSMVRGKVGYCILPGAKKVWNYKTESWQNFPEINYAPFLAFGGWIAAITATCEHPEAAFNFLQFLSSPEISLQDVLSSDTGYNPYRYSHFSNISVWREAGYIHPEEYLKVMEDSVKHPNAQPDMRIPGGARYQEILDLYVSKALAGQLSPKAALDKVYEEWNKLTDELGREKQLELYRQSLGLPPLGD